MASDKRSLLDVLKAELDFLEKGGYRQTARAAWRPQFIFQDSPTCLNFDPTQEPRPCSDCVLTQLVPLELAEKKVPCRYIPLNERGETIDSLYRCGTAEELEAVLGRWLKQIIRRLEQEKKNSAAAEETTEEHVHTKTTEAGLVYRKEPKDFMFSPCANRDCRAAFDYREGRLFRFHKAYPVGEKPPNTHAVQHFWLCGNCSADYTLAYEDGYGVVILRRADTAGRPVPCRFVAAA